MAQDTIRLRGVDEVLAFLKTVPSRVQRNVMRASVRAGAAYMLAQVRPAIPRRSGKLAASARISTRARGVNVSASVVVGSRGKKGDAWYAPIVEGGAKRHVIKARKGGVLALGLGRLVRVVKHPGFRGRQFMRRAAAAHWQGALDAVVAKARERIARLKDEA